MFRFMSERFEMRVEPEWLVKVDAWRAIQTPIPSRSAAIRRLADTGLALAAIGYSFENLAAERAKSEARYRALATSLPSHLTRKAAR
jgi:hypothetical protein